MKTIKCVVQKRIFPYPALSLQTRSSPRRPDNPTVIASPAHRSPICKTFRSGASVVWTISGKSSAAGRKYSAKYVDSTRTRGDFESFALLLKHIICLNRLIRENAKSSDNWRFTCDQNQLLVELVILSSIN